MLPPFPGYDVVMTRFAAKRRRTLLGQARDMALGDYHNTVQVTPRLNLERCADASKVPVFF